MCRIPLWVWLFKEKKNSLRQLHKQLLQMEPDHMPDQVSNIEIHPMDFRTGNTDTSLIQFFTPDTDTVFKIANTALDPEDPVDDPFTWVRAMKKNQHFIPREMHYQLYKAFSKYVRKSLRGRNSPIYWDPIP